MYGQLFSYCVFPDGQSCQVEDIASGWCSAPFTAAPTAPPETTAPPSGPAAVAMVAPQQQQANPLLSVLPYLFGTAGSSTPGASSDSTSGGNGGLGYSSYTSPNAAVAGPGGAAAGMIDPTTFFGSQGNSIASTGVTPQLVSQLATSQAQQGGFAPSPPQPIPLVMPGTTPQGASPTPSPSPSLPPLPLPALAPATPAPAPAPTPFFGLTNPILWIAAAALVAVVFFLWRRYSLKKRAETSGARSAGATTSAPTPAAAQRPAASRAPQ